MLTRLVRSAKPAIQLVNAFSATSEKRYVDALGHLAQIGRVGETDHEVRLLKGLLCVRLSRFPEAFREYVAAYDLISSSPRLSGPAKAYLETVAARGALYAADRLPPDERPGLGVMRPAELSEIDLNRIPEHIKRNFPLPEHPDWGRMAGRVSVGRQVRTWLKRCLLWTR
jgi:hypothetical protein